MVRLPPLLFVFYSLEWQTFGEYSCGRGLTKPKWRRDSRLALAGGLPADRAGRQQQKGGAMPNRGCRHFTLGMLGLCTAVLALTAGAAVAAADRDTQEVSRYVLTEAGLAKYSAASTNLSKLDKSSLTAGCKEENPSSLDKVVAKADADPGVKAAIQGADECRFLQGAQGGHRQAEHRQKG
jgi:hypothetical protein